MEGRRRIGQLKQAGGREDAHGLVLVLGQTGVLGCPGSGEDVNHKCCMELSTKKEITAALHEICIFKMFHLLLQGSIQPLCLGGSRLLRSDSHLT